MITSKHFLLLFFIVSIPMHLGDKNFSKDVHNTEEIHVGNMIMKFEKQVKHIDNNQESIIYSNEEGEEIIEIVSAEDAVDEEQSIKMEGYTKNLENYANITKTEKGQEGYIVGGDYANIADYPHAVFLVACGKTCWACGSSVLNQRILLTAAHCMPNGYKKWSIDLFAGSSDHEKATVTTTAKKIVSHPRFSYDHADTIGDIALMFVADNLPLGRTIQRVIISPSFPQKAAELDGHLAGWGLIDEKETTSTRLKVVRQKVWAKSDCLKRGALAVCNFCASSETNKDHPFHGDSGSALINKNKQQLGVLSCLHRRTRVISYLVNVSYSYYWIDTMSKKLYCV